MQPPQIPLFIPDRDFFLDLFLNSNYSYRTGIKNMLIMNLIKSTHDIAHIIRATRKQLGVTQSDLALAAGTGLRFIIDLEKGKATCQIGKILQVIQVLGIQCSLSHPEV